MPDNLQFEEEDNLLHSRIERGSKAPKFSEWLVKIGAAKDTKQATYVLFGVIGVAVIISIVTSTFFGSSDVEPIDSITGEDVLPQR